MFNVGDIVRKVRCSGSIGIGDICRVTEIIENGLGNIRVMRLCDQYVSRTDSDWYELYDMQDANAGIDDLFDEFS